MVYNPRRNTHSNNLDQLERLRLIDEILFIRVQNLEDELITTLAKRRLPYRKPRMTEDESNLRIRSDLRRMQTVRRRIRCQWVGVWAIT